MNRINISHRLRSYRKQRSLTQEAFADLIGVSPQAVSKWEREECYPDITLLPELAELLDCNIDDFFDKIPPPF
ncbi:MAG: helix-turn-helix transcriptional regulator [Clostridia bacterium]|nr:helix-turn-helix transcriptional regulator [Clostridia bacterium]